MFSTCLSIVLLLLCLCFVLDAIIVISSISTSISISISIRISICRAPCRSVGSACLLGGLSWPRRTMDMVMSLAHRSYSNKSLSLPLSLSLYIYIYIYVWTWSCPLRTNIARPPTPTTEPPLFRGLYEVGLHILLYTTIYYQILLYTTIPPRRNMSYRAAIVGVAGEMVMVMSFNRELEYNIPRLHSPTGCRRFPEILLEQISVCFRRTQFSPVCSRRFL